MSKDPSDQASDNLAATSAAAQAIAQKLPRGNKTITVACKMPHGVVIRDQQEFTEYEQGLSGERRKVSVFRAVGPRIHIKGSAVPDTLIRQVEIVGGYAITEGIPADVFERWMEWNKDAPFVVNQLIYGHENGARVRSWAVDHSVIRSGFEPLDVSTKTERGREVFKDERVRTAGADQVVDGKLEPTAA